MTRVNNVVQIDNFEITINVTDPAVGEELATLLLEASTYRRATLEAEQEARASARSKG